MFGFALIYLHPEKLTKLLHYEQNAYDVINSI